MNRKDEWLNYFALLVILMAVSKLGVDTVGGEWHMVFLMATGATTVVFVFTMAIIYEYEPIAKYAYSYAEGDSDE